MPEVEKTPQDAKEVFRNCGTCSQTFAHLLNVDHGHPMENEERALDPLAGGILNQGHQCGMLWGAALAVGAEAFRRNKDLDQAIATAVTATQHLVESFVNRTQTVNCREIIGTDLSHVFGLVKFMLKTMVTGMDKSQCFEFAEAWAPEAIQAGADGLSGELIQLKGPVRSCASEVVKRMGGSDAERAMVAGFAGGLGLTGNACGALGAAIWMKTLAWCRDNPGKTPPMFGDAPGKKVLKAFEQETGSELLCHKITGKHFDSIDEHSEFISEGGCEKLLSLLS
jgi:hypothetical protein